jgi:hypothetical protein
VFTAVGKRKVGLLHDLLAGHIVQHHTQPPGCQQLRLHHAGRASPREEGVVERLPELRGRDRRHVLKAIAEVEIALEHDLDRVTAGTTDRQHHERDPAAGLVLQCETHAGRTFLRSGGGDREHQRQRHQRQRRSGQHRARTRHPTTAAGSGQTQHRSIGQRGHQVSAFPWA